MPYSIRKNKSGGYDVVRKADGKVVGHSDTLEDAKGTIWHREHGESKNKLRNISRK